MMTRRSLLTALLAVLAALAAPASARGDVEPNDTPETANGPVVSDVRYEGTLETEDDEDRYAVHVDAMRTLAITGDTTGGDGCFTLEPRDGVWRERVCVFGDDLPATETVTVSRGTYYLAVGGFVCCAVPGTTYGFTISAPGGLTTGACLAAEDDVLRFRGELDAAQARLQRAARRLAQRRTRETIRDLRFALDAATQRQALDCAP